MTKAYGSTTGYIAQLTRTSGARVMGFLTKLALFIFTVSSLPKSIVRIVTLAFGVSLAYRFDKWLSSKKTKVDHDQPEKRVSRFPALKKFLPSGLTSRSNGQKRISSSDTR